MRIAVAGGTGTLGRGVAGELRSRGHEVRVLSRRSGRYRVDLATGAGADARETARIWRSATGRRALLLPVPLPGQLGRALRREVLVSQRPDVTGTVRFADWLAALVPVSR
jgi:nucleoside-diphosphate-sugar epimerase